MEAGPLDQGCIGREAGGGGGWPDPPSSYGPLRVPAEGGPKILKPKSSWHRRCRSKVWLKDWKGRRGGGSKGGWGGGALLLWLSAVLIHPCPRPPTGTAAGGTAGAYSGPPALSSGPALTGPPGHTGERAAAGGCGLATRACGSGARSGGPGASQWPDDAEGVSLWR